LRRLADGAPNLLRSDRLLCGFWSLFLSPGRLPNGRRRPTPFDAPRLSPGVDSSQVPPFVLVEAVPKETRTERANEALIQAIVELKARNPRFGCPRIARIISGTFGVDVDKNIAYRVLSKHYRPAPGGTGPSCSSFIGHTRDSLWSVDLFRYESIVLRSYWVLLVMDQFTRRLVGIGVHGGAVTGADICRMFTPAIHALGTPRHLSTAHHPLFEAHATTKARDDIVLADGDVRRARARYL
jgi:hypothetical protein